jgi:hypothetical protein
MFILKASLGGSIGRDELPSYPSGHYYTVQENAWMDSVGWGFYVKNVLKNELDGPAVLLADNFDCHVSEEGQRVVAEEVFSVVYPLPANSTSTCQPLDVGVMGPLKSKIRHLATIAKGEAPVTAKEKRIAAIKRTIAAWNGIHEDVIARSFEKAIPRTSAFLNFL